MKSIITAFFICCLSYLCEASGINEKLFVYCPKDAHPLEIKAAKELCAHLSGIYSDCDFATTHELSTSPAVAIGCYDRLKEQFKLNGIERPENGGFVITSAADEKTIKKFIIGSDPRSNLDAVYTLLEKLGYGFYLTHDTKPLQKDKIDFTEWDTRDNPLFEDRIVFNWHNFLSGCTGWDYSDWLSWIDQASKMRYNSIMVHAYANSPMFQFEMNGIKKPVGYMNTSNSGRDWGGQHVNDVRLLPGGHIFNSPVFGAGVAKVPDQQRVNAATGLMQKVFRHAKEEGLKVIFALDCDTKASSPQEMVLSLPEKARFKVENAWLVNPEEPEGYSYYKKQVADLLATYPEIDKLALWVRGEENSEWCRITPKDMPEKWRKEYDDFVRNESKVSDNMRTSGAFAIAKMVKAFQKALKELGHDHVEVMLGSWRWEFVGTANYIMPKDVTFIPLDYAYNLDQSATKQELSQIGARRKLIPVIWAHHDDHRYIGRSYLPYSHFTDLLNEEKASGFGIIHWTSTPHNLFFKNISRQTWSGSRNESLKSSIKDFVHNEWKTDSPALNRYLYEWSTGAPMFGQETGSSFFGYREFNLIKDEFESCDRIIDKSKERLALLESINERDIARNIPLFEHMKSMEHFYIDFFINQKYFNRAYELIKEKKIDEAVKELTQTHPEKIIESYSDTIRKGFGNVGEKGIVYSMGTRYYPHFINLKQQAGISPVNFRFAKTAHDPLAQHPGIYTWFIDGKKDFWRVLGKKEMGRKIRESDDCISFDEAIELDLKTICNNALPAGEYEISLTSPSSDISSDIDIFIINNKGDKMKMDFQSNPEISKKQIRFNVQLAGKISRIQLVPKREVSITTMSIAKH